ncbi:hypothetical protein F5890DRAFT_1567177 [Lentinula detonsa]|uniref:Uncharacterized protein n=1 Tax=Lentinula detonsa TaxID=2804962 RepID=A0AA38UQX6_9AGAR|nr:hypothetical protein F5890DRAFT_1567177 [Lentinula detonsa]
MHPFPCGILLPILLVLGTFTGMAYASPISEIQARAGSTSSSLPPAPSPRFSVIANLRNKFNGKSKKSPGPSKFSSLKHHTVGYGFTRSQGIDDATEVPLSKINVKLDDTAQSEHDVFLVPTPNYAFTDQSLCMIYTTQAGLNKFKTLPMIYEKDDIYRLPPYELDKQPIDFFAARVRNEKAITITMHIPQIHVGKAEEIGLHTQCLKPGSKRPALWAEAEWHKYKVPGWPAKLRASSHPGEPTIKQHQLRDSQSHTASHTASPYQHAEVITGVRQA